LTLATQTDSFRGNSKLSLLLLMKKYIPHLVTALFATASVYAEDIVVFKNGDVLTGKIIKQDSEHVYFKTGSFGSVSLNTPDIAEIRIETPETGEVSIPAEAIAPAAVAAPPPAPAATPQAPPEKPSQWTGQAGLQVAMREKTNTNAAGIGNEEKYQTYRVYGHVNWKGEKNNLNWNWTYRYSEDETRTRDDYFNITQKYNHNLKNGYYGEAKTVYQRDYNRRIDNEYLQTAEIGKKWFQRPKFKFSTSVGAGYHKYERSVSGSSTTTSEPKFIFDESIEWTMINSLTLFQKYTHLGDLDKFHFVFTSGLENKLIRDIFLRLEYRLDRDTETSYDDKAYYDKALLTSLLYKF